MLCKNPGLKDKVPCDPRKGTAPLGNESRRGHTQVTLGPGRLAGRARVFLGAWNLPRVVRDVCYTGVHCPWTVTHTLCAFLCVQIISQLFKNNKRYKMWLDRKLNAEKWASAWFTPGRRSPRWQILKWTVCAVRPPSRGLGFSLSLLLTL